MEILIGTKQPVSHCVLNKHLQPTAYDNLFKNENGDE